MPILVGSFIGLALFALVWLWPVVVQAQAGNGINQPAAGDVVSGVVIVQGTAMDPNFLRYEVAFFQEFNPGAGWIVFADGNQPVNNGTLAVWDTTVGRNVNAPVFPDGRYQLRLRVVRTDYNYSEYFVNNLIIANDQPTPTPTITTTATVTEAPPSEPGVTLVAPQPPLLPSLTPFPTPSPQATPANEPQGTGDSGPDDGDNGGLWAQLQAIDTGRFGRAFWQGVLITAYAFGALALYFLSRAIIRRLWRLILMKMYK